MKCCVFGISVEICLQLFQDIEGAFKEFLRLEKSHDQTNWMESNELKCNENNPIRRLSLIEMCTML